MFLTNLSKPTETVATVGVTILSIVVAVATTIASLPPGTLQNAFNFKTNPIGAILALCTVIIAIAGTVKAGAGRSFVPQVDGVTSLDVPTGSTVHVETQPTIPKPTI